MQGLKAYTWERPREDGGRIVVLARDGKEARKMARERLDSSALSTNWWSKRPKVISVPTVLLV